MLTQICFISLFLLIWFKTKAFVEYCSFFKPLKRLFKIDQFEEIQNNGGDLNYPEFLLEYYNNFFTRLISCPICLATWAGLFLSIFNGFGLLGVNVIFGLLIYLIMGKLL